ncbi:hypothetical protein K1719_024356 [Acacia pycnantha]|nr:hypothetical protein K1719_024356 [Acacia pycnantha]
MSRACGPVKESKGTVEDYDDQDCGVVQIIDEFMELGLSGVSGTGLISAALRRDFFCDFDPRCPPSASFFLARPQI